MSNMLFDYTLPDYAEGDPDYKYCKNFTEVEILRMVKTYVDFVKQRYSKRIIGHTSFKPKGKYGKCLRTTPRYKELAEIVAGLKQRDPAHFIAFVFEFWPKRKAYAKFVDLGYSEIPGCAYPSWKYIINNKDQLLEYFHNRPEYTPKDFVPKDDFKLNYSVAVENRMRRWCGFHGKTPREYWLTGQHLFPPYMSSKDFPYACEHKDGLKDYEEDIEEEFGFTLKELGEFLIELEALQDMVYDARYAAHTERQEQGLPLQFGLVSVLPLEAAVDEKTIERVQYAFDAQERGRDINTTSFEEETNNAINEVDYDSADTVLYYLYGTGDGPRHRFD